MSPSQRRRGGRAGHQSGFSLLEAIVTLVIVSLLVTVLMQALSMAIGLRSRVQSFQTESRLSLLQESWFREAVAGMQRDADETGGFVGRPDELSYSTPAPLVASGFSSVRWWLVDGQLHYSDRAASDVRIISGGLDRASFSYMDSAGEWSAEWVPTEAEVLPKIVRLEASTPKGEIDWWVPVMVEGIDPNMMKLDGMGSHGI
jgi:prepilin-type N-terminal cleavage/methylation domain-containing protein